MPASTGRPDILIAALAILVKDRVAGIAGRTQHPAIVQPQH
ncbi:MAG: hypothetical protein RLO51_13010 [Thalassobaculum sp.]